MKENDRGITKNQGGELRKRDCGLLIQIFPHETQESCYWSGNIGYNFIYRIVEDLCIKLLKIVLFLNFLWRNCIIIFAFDQKLGELHTTHAKHYDEKF